VSNIYNSFTSVGEGDDLHKDELELNLVENLVVEEVFALLRLLEIDHRVLLEGSAEVEAGKFGLQSKNGNLLVSVILTAVRVAKKDKLNNAVSEFFCRVVHIYGDLRRLEDLVAALLDISMQSNDEDLSSLLLSAPVMTALLQIFRSATSLQRSQCWDRLLSDENMNKDIFIVGFKSSVAKVLFVVLLKTETVSECSEERFRSLIKLLEICRSNESIGQLESQILFVAVCQFSAQATSFLSIDVSTKTLLTIFAEALRSTFRIIAGANNKASGKKKDASIDCSLAALYCSRSLENFVLAIDSTIAFNDKSNEEKVESLTDELLSSIFSRKISQGDVGVTVQAGLLGALSLQPPIEKIISHLDENQIQLFFGKVKSNLPNVLETEFGLALLPICFHLLNESHSSTVTGIDLATVNFLGRLLSAGVDLHNKQVSELWHVYKRKIGSCSSLFLDNIAQILTKYLNFIAYIAF